MNGFWLNKTIEDWQGRIPRIISSFEEQISDINEAKSNVASGRVGNGCVAQNADALLSSRLCDVTSKKANWDTTIRNRVISLQRTGYQTDNAVAQMVTDSQVAFFNTYSWLRPEVQTSSFRDWWNEFWGGVGETLSNAWQGIKDFFTDAAIFQIVASGLEVAAGVVVIAVGGIGAILSAGTATPLSIAAITGGLAMIAHGSGGLQEGIQVYSGDENPSNWLKDMVGETAYNIIGIGGAVVSAFATGGVSALFQLGAGMGVGMGSSWIVQNVFGCDSTVSQWIGLGTGLFAAWGAGKVTKILIPEKNVQLDPSKVRFSQENVSDYSKHIKLIKDNNNTYPETWDNVSVVRMKDGQLTTFDHRRILAATETGIKVKANIYDYRKPLPKGFANQRFKSPKMPNPQQYIKTWGDAIRYRVNNSKNPSFFKSQYPSGSWELPKINISGGKK